MHKFGFRRVLHAGKLLMAGMLLIAGMMVFGCGKREEGDSSAAGIQAGEESMAVDSGQTGNGSDSGQTGNGSDSGQTRNGPDSGQTGNEPDSGQTENEPDAGSDAGSLDEEKLYFRYRSVSMDKGLLGMENQLLDMECLAAERGVYVAGARLNAGAMETAVYLVEMDGQPGLLVSIPQEKLISWCRTEEGIAVLGMRAEASDEGFERFYTLHSFRGENLEEEETWPLTDALAEAGMTEGSFGAMAVREGEVALSGHSGKQIITVDFADGAISGTISVQSNFKELKYIDDETLLGITGTQELYVLHPGTGGREVKAEGLLKEAGAVSHCMIGENRILGGSSRGLYAASLEGGNGVGPAKALMDYEYGLEPESSLWFSEAQETGILASWNQEKRKLGIYYLSGDERGSAETDDRETVTLSGFSVTEELRKAVLDFNQGSEQYRIEVLEEDGSLEIADLASRLETQMMAGKGADLLTVNTWIWFRDYVENGFLEDLAPYIERDLKAEDYVGSALYAYEKDGEIYAMEPSFALAVLISDTGITKGAEAWTLPDMYRLAEQSGVPLFGKGYDTQALLSVCLEWLGSGIYDMGQVRDCILFAEKYGSPSADSQSYPRDAVLGEDYMTVQENITSPLSLADVEMFYGDDISLIGYPREQGGRIAHVNDYALSINKASEHKDGAWAFIRFLLGENYQFSEVPGNRFPVLKEAYEAMLDKYLKPNSYDIYLPEAGGIITVENGWALSRSMSTIEAMTEEQIGRLRKLVEESGVDIWYRETGAAGIICEEAAGYYQGDKPLEQVMEVIEGRLKIYRGN